MTASLSRGSIGKAVARIEESPTDPEYGGVDHGTVLIHFTDGTALEIEGSSYEEVSQSLELLTVEEVHRRQRATAGRREQERLRRLQREEWLSLTCEERGARKRAREAKMSPGSLLMKDVWSDAYAGLLLSSSRMLYGGQPERTVRFPCENCGERVCENAPTKTYPATPAMDWSGGFSVKVAPGSSDASR